MSNRAPTLPQPPQTRLFRNKREDKGEKEIKYGGAQRCQRQFRDGEA